MAVKLDDVSSLKELVEEMQANNIAWKSVATKRKVESFIREHDIDLVRLLLANATKLFAYFLYKYDCRI